jgi:Fe-S cluster assembly protein SufD
MVTLEGERAQVAVHEGGMVKSDLTSLLTVEHRAPRTCSFVLSKRVVLENGTSNFDGWIRVDPNAGGSKARQMNYNLLISNKSQAVSTPHLEVRTPDVECHHGTATRRLETEDLFYMNTRGVAVEEAKKLFVLGFTNAILEHLPVGLMEMES